MCLRAKTATKRHELWEVAYTEVWTAVHKRRSKITDVGVRRRAELYYQQLDGLRPLHQQARRELLAESRKHNATKLLRQIPSIGPIRAVLLLALIQTPHRFRTKRQLWAYSGLALETRNSGEYCIVHGQLKRSKKVVAIRGLNKNHNHDLKNIFKGVAIRAAAVAGPFPGVLRGFGWQRNETTDGASHLGAQDRAYRTSPIKRNVKRKTSPPGPMPVLFRLGIQPNCLNVHPRSESGLPQAESPVSSPRAKRRYASSSLWFHFTVVTAPVIF